jgi:hypothetical protein
MYHTTEDIPAHGVGSEHVLATGRQQTLSRRNLGRRVRCNHGGHDRDHNEQEQKGNTEKDSWIPKSTFQRRLLVPKLVVANPRIENCVTDVHEQVDHNEDRDREEQQRLHEREILRGN